MTAVVQTKPRRVNELQVRLVNERRRAERRIGFTAQPLTGKLPHAVVHERDELIERLGIALSPSSEELRDLIGACRHVARGRSPGRSVGRIRV